MKENLLTRLFRYLVLHIHYFKKVNFDISCVLSLKSSFEGANKIFNHSIFRGTMGYGSYIGPYSEIEANIGRFTSIASYVRTNIGIHPLGTPFATTSPMFFSTQKQNGKTFADRMMFNEFKEFTRIGNDVWVGENVFFAGGLVIGDGAVILAGAVSDKGCATICNSWRRSCKGN